MSKKPNRIDTLATAYCDLIESKLPIIGLHQRQFLDDMKSMVTKFLTENTAAGLEDLYERFGNPVDTANRLAAIIADPESAEDPIMAYYAQTDDASDNNCECHCDDDCPMADILRAYDIANAMADDGTPIADIAVETGLPLSLLYMGGWGDPNADMRDFIIPVRYQMTGLIKVRATSIEDAIITTINDDTCSPIPVNARMVHDTYDVCTNKDTVAMYTDLYRSGKLGYEPTDSGIVSPLQHRDQILEDGDMAALSHILRMHGIHIDDEPAYAFEQRKHDEIRPEDFDGAHALAVIDTECDGKCDECDVIKAFGDCPIRHKHENHSADQKINLHMTVPCYGICDECPVKTYLNDCPLQHIINGECDCCDGSAEQAVNCTCHADSDNEDQVCFFDDIDELPLECQPMSDDDED